MPCFNQKTSLFGYFIPETLKKKKKKGTGLCFLALLQKLAFKYFLCQKCERIHWFNKHQNEYIKIGNPSSLFNTISPELKGVHQEGIKFSIIKTLISSQNSGNDTRKTFIVVATYVQFRHLLFQKPGGPIINLHGNN